MPDDIWLVDLDSTKLSSSGGVTDEIPPLPEPEGTILKNHLKQVLFQCLIHFSCTYFATLSFVRSSSLFISMCVPLILLSKHPLSVKHLSAHTYSLPTTPFLLQNTFFSSFIANTKWFSFTFSFLYSKQFLPI